MTTGLSISEINALVSSGAEIMEDGSIQFATVLPSEEDTEMTIETTTDVSEQMILEETERSAESSNGMWLGILLSLFIGVGLGTFKIIMRKKYAQRENADLIQGGEE